jgi:hypothetical protein
MGPGNLWSYPNLHIDKKVGGKGAGKELCDLLVVCGDDVVVFSDKTIAWPEHSDAQVSWRRWCRRAIQKSVDQVNGAIRWLETYPERVFLDIECTKHLPISLPSTINRKVHGVLVARGAGPACLRHFNEGIGSLLVIPELKGQEHLGENAMSFAVGDVNPDGPFIHVLDGASLDIALQELDTVTDFTQYLSKKEALIKSES